MTRRSLRPQLNQIRAWVREGRTDAWIAHQLEATVQQIRAFKRENDLAPDGDAGGDAGPDLSDDVDLRAEDDAAIAAELDEAEKQRAEEEAKRKEEEARRKEAEAEARKAKAAERKAKGEEDSDADSDSDPDDADEEKPKPRRRRSRRGGKGRSGGRALEGTFDHGEEGYGLWLDPAVQDDSTYAEHWAGHRPVTVAIEEDQIVIRRVEDDSSDD